MTRDELTEVAEYMRLLEEDSTVRIVFKPFNSIYGMTYRGHNDKYLMLINQNLSHEKQIETLLHEAKHIYSHLGQNGELKIFDKEKEADSFAQRCMKDNLYAAMQLRSVMMLCLTIFFTLFQNICSC